MENSEKVVVSSSIDNNNKIHVSKSDILKTDVFTDINKIKNDLVTKWICKSHFEETSSEISENASASSVVLSSLATENGDFDDDDDKIIQHFNGIDLDSGSKKNDSFVNVFENVLQPKLSDNNHTVNEVQIENSTNVHVGNVTYIMGPCNITYVNSVAIKNPGNSEKQNFNFLDDQSVDGLPFGFIDRITWLARRPFEPYEYIDHPVELVIIAHTVTEMSTTHVGNASLVRNIQHFHIEANGWNDIGYNFLIGCDGNIYEGRGWNVVGAHSKGYNNISLGISFIGCFVKELPPKIAIDACQFLIKRGVELGHLSPEYKLLAHCQCRPFESPGRRLFDELRTWKNFCN